MRPLGRVSLSFMVIVASSLNPPVTSPRHVDWALRAARPGRSGGDSATLRPRHERCTRARGADSDQAVGVRPRGGGITVSGGRPSPSMRGRIDGRDGADAPARGTYST